MSKMHVKYVNRKCYRKLKPVELKNWLKFETEQRIVRQDKS